MGGSGPVLKALIRPVVAVIAGGIEKGMELSQTQRAVRGLGMYTIMINDSCSSI